MADKEIIGARLEVDTGNSSSSLKDVNQNIKEVKSSLSQTSEVAKKTGKDIEGTTGHFANLKNGLSSIPGPLSQASSGVNTLQIAFKALLANPVVLILTAIVAVLALLYKAFTNTFEGGQKVEQVFAGIKAAGQALLDNLAGIGRAIVKFFSFDFSGAIAEIKGVADAASAAYNRMADLTRQAQELAREQSQNDLEQVERQRKLTILREQASDDSVPREERKFVFTVSLVVIRKW